MIELDKAIVGKWATSETLAPLGIAGPFADISKPGTPRPFGIVSPLPNMGSVRNAMITPGEESRDSLETIWFQLAVYGVGKVATAELMEAVDRIFNCQPLEMGGSRGEILLMCDRPFPIICTDEKKLNESLQPLFMAVGRYRFTVQTSI